jgi:alanyl-tRNA synthetase
MALFGEKYGDEVRVVSMGKGVHGAKAPALFGRTLRRHPCGRTGDIGLVRSSRRKRRGAGVRRIEALTGESGARIYLNEQDERLKPRRTS